MSNEPNKVANAPEPDGANQPNAPEAALKSEVIVAPAPASTESDAAKK
jgi:hypothetical protein